MQSTIPKPVSRLTPRQLQLLKAIATFQANQCYSPTIAELSCELNISRSTVFEHIAELRKKVHIRTSPGRARSLKLTSLAQELLSQAHKAVAANFNAEHLADIPLVGRVAAGLPIEAIENKNSLSLKSCFGNTDDVFALEVAGDSMVDDGICDGDYVICRRTAVAQNGQLVIAILDDQDATLKRFYKEKAGIRLQPANDNYDPIYCDNCRVQAIVTGLVRKF